MGTAVFGGMVVATVMTVIFVPVFFQVFQALGERYLGEGRGNTPHEPESGTNLPSTTA